MTSGNNSARDSSSDKTSTAEVGGHLVQTAPAGRRPNVEAEMDGRQIKAGYTWFRGEHTSFLPNKALLAAPDAIQKYILHGLMPAEPFISAETRITAFGSCFAANISKYLNSKHYNVMTKGDTKAYVVIHGEGMVHSYAIRQQFEWALEGKEVNTELWHDKSAKAQEADDEVRETTRKLFMETDVFILTFGLSEVWYSKETGDVFWRGVPSQMFDPERHGFRVVTPEENRTNIQAIYDIIRRHRPEARIIFTLSPVPLIATFRPVPCFIANSYSKGSLRVAIDDVFRANSHDDRFFYWPSYEVITEFFTDSFMSDRRHPLLPIIDHIMRLFEEYYCIPMEGRDRPPLIQTLTSAAMAAGALPQKVRFALRNENRDEVRRIAKEELEAGNREYAEFLEQAAEGYSPTPK